MNNNENRKVLISVKVSTLLLILIAIIILITTGVVVANKVSTQNFAEETIENSEETVLPEENQKLASVTITSRSSEPRTEEIQEEPEVVENTMNGVGAIVVEEPVEEFMEEPVEEVVQTTPISDITIAVDMDLTVRTGLSREDFIILMANVKQDTSGFFEENAGLIYDTCEKYSINEIFFCGLISAESGWDIAANHRRTYNYISLMSGSGLIKFSSVEDGIEKAAQTLHDRYLTPGGSCYYGVTLSAVKTRFCPASSTWVNLVYQRMDQIMKNR